MEELIAILFSFVSKACCCVTGNSQFLKREYIQIKRNRLRQMRLESVYVPGAYRDAVIVRKLKASSQESGKTGSVCTGPEADEALLLI